MLAKNANDNAGIWINGAAAFFASKLAPCMLALCPKKEVMVRGHTYKQCVSGGGRPLLKAGSHLTLSIERAPRLIAHYEEYREADKSDFALQGCSGMKFEVGGTGDIFAYFPGS